MVDWTKYAISTLTVALLVSLGFNVLPDDTHFCRDLEISMKCDRLSGTGNTCYPNSDSTSGKKYCGSGWETIIKTDMSSRVYDCDNENGCVLTNNNV
jgi:hypothetical protein